MHVLTRRLSSSLLPPFSGSKGLLVGSTGLSALGIGAMVPLTPIFFVKFAGLAVTEVGLAMSVAAAVGLLWPVPAGWLCDRYGARSLLVTSAWLTSAAILSYPFVSSFAELVLAQCVLTTSFTVSRVAENSAVGHLVSGAERTELKAHQRTVFNIAFASGALLAAIPLELDVRSAYLAVIAGDALALLLVGVVLLHLPRLRAAESAHTLSRWSALRSRKYVTVAVLSGLSGMHISLLMVALPLWVITRTGLPESSASVLLVTNTLMVIGLQVWAARKADLVIRARAIHLRGALALMVACPLIGAAGGRSGPVAALLLMVGVIVFTLGEIWLSASEWTFSFALADQRLIGQFQGAFALATGLGRVIGPTAATGVVLHLGAAGWALAGCFFAIVGLAVFAAVGRTAPAEAAG